MFDKMSLKFVVLVQLKLTISETMFKTNGGLVNPGAKMWAAWPVTSR